MIKVLLRTALLGAPVAASLLGDAGALARVGQSCSTADQCRGELPHLCQLCRNGGDGCAHWACVHHKCVIAYCPAK